MLGESATLSIADLRGKVVVVNFWASWCEPCKAEAPVLDRAHKRLQRDGAGTKLARDYASTKVPETFVIDARGRIADVLRGQITQQRLDAALSKALQ